MAARVLPLLFAGLAAVPNQMQRAFLCSRLLRRTVDKLVVAGLVHVRLGVFATVVVAPAAESVREGGGGCPAPKNKEFLRILNFCIQRWQPSRWPRLCVLVLFAGRAAAPSKPNTKGFPALSHLALDSGYGGGDESCGRAACT